MNCIFLQLLRIERKNLTTTVLLVVHVLKQNRPLDPYSVVQILRNADVNDLAIYLKEIIDKSVVAYGMFIDDLVFIHKPTTTYFVQAKWSLAFYLTVKRIVAVM